MPAVASADRDVRKPQKLQFPAQWGQAGAEGSPVWMKTQAGVGPDVHSMHLGRLHVTQLGYLF